MIVTCWMHLLLFCLCCHHEIQPAACKPLWMSQQFPCDVTSYNTSQVLFDCRGRRLNAVPQGITSNATELDLSENLIKNISAESFPNLPSLTRLDLSWANKNKAVIIAANAFKNLTKLHKLSLTGNRLNEIPGNLPLSLEILDLSYNQIMFLDNSSLVGLTNVTKLLLSRNCYTWNPCGRSVTIMKDSFAVMTELDTLDLSFNNLTHVPKGLPQSLSVLILASNMIQQISKYDFLGLQNLKALKYKGTVKDVIMLPIPVFLAKMVLLRSILKHFTI